jgi:hypothetical protein
MKYTKNKKTTKTPMSLRISSKRLSHNRVRLVKVLFSWLSNVFVNSKSSSSFLIRYIDFVYEVQNKIIKKIKKKFKQISSNGRPLLLGTECNKKPLCHMERIKFRVLDSVSCIYYMRLLFYSDTNAHRFYVFEVFQDPIETLHGRKIMWKPFYS